MINVSKNRKVRAFQRVVLDRFDQEIIKKMFLCFRKYNTILFIPERWMRRLLRLALNMKR